MIELSLFFFAKIAMVCQEDGWEGGGFTSFGFRGFQTEAASKQQVKIVSKHQERERERERERD